MQQCYFFYRDFNYLKIRLFRFIVCSCFTQLEPDSNHIIFIGGPRISSILWKWIPLCDIFFISVFFQPLKTGSVRCGILLFKQALSCYNHINSLATDSDITKFPLDNDLVEKSIFISHLRVKNHGKNDLNQEKNIRNHHTDNCLINNNKYFGHVR